MVMEILSTAELERVKAQLAELVAKRPEISKRIAAARELGDLKENADYHAAREDQGVNEARIKQLEDRVGSVIVTDDDDSTIPEDMVFLGATTHLRDADTGRESSYRLVGELSGDYEDDVIEVTSQSPMGSALMRSRIGEVIRVDLPRGTKRFEIIGIE